MMINIVNWNRFSAAAIAERSLKNAIHSLIEIREKKFVNKTC